jgi:hypothetical protein
MDEQHCGSPADDRNGGLSSSGSISNVKVKVLELSDCCEHPTAFPINMTA